MLAVGSTESSGELAGTRTQDPRLKRALLYQLSYELTSFNSGDRRVEFYSVLRFSRLLALAAILATLSRMRNGMPGFMRSLQCVRQASVWCPSTTVPTSSLPQRRPDRQRGRMPGRAWLRSVPVDAGVRMVVLPVEPVVFQVVDARQALPFEIACGCAPVECPFA